MMPFAGTKFYVRNNGGWTYRLPGEEMWELPEDARPVVVIDPTDTEAVDRLVGVLSKTYAKAGLQFLSMGQMFHEERSGTFADALREFANPKPPKPEEPTGLYARVEDVKGRIFVRTAEQSSVWRREARNSMGQRYLIPQDGCDNWTDIAVARVLNPGVMDDGRPTCCTGEDSSTCCPVP
jgi:hypothetical protein